MEYKELIESCRKAISEEKCLGCSALENPSFIGNSNCEHLKNKTYEGEQIKWKK